MEEEVETIRRILDKQQVESSAVAYSAPAPEVISSISSSISIVGKIDGKIVGSSGRLSIFGHVEGQIHATTVEIGDGAQIEGNIVAEELTIGGRVKGTIHANRVKLNSTAVVEGDIHHQSLEIDANAQFEGMSKRQKNATDPPSLVPAARSQTQAIDITGPGGGAPDGANPSQAQAAPTSTGTNH